MSLTVMLCHPIPENVSEGTAALPQRKTVKECPIIGLLPNRL